MRIKSDRPSPLLRLPVTEAATPSEESPDITGRPNMLYAAPQVNLDNHESCLLKLNKPHPVLQHTGLK